MQGIILDPYWETMPFPGRHQLMVRMTEWWNPKKNADDERLKNLKTNSQYAKNQNNYEKKILLQQLESFFSHKFCWDSHVANKVSD